MMFYDVNYIALNAYDISVCQVAFRYKDYVNILIDNEKYKFLHMLQVIRVHRFSMLLICSMRTFIICLNSSMSYHGVD